MPYNFCTFFNKKFLVQGLALYNSLERFCPDFKLWVLCMDDETHSFLKKLNLEKLELVSIPEFEDPRIIEVKNQPGRSYYGTIKPSFILYVLQKNPELDLITYLDTDLFFFSSPSSMLSKLGKESEYNILITPHRLPPSQKFREKRNGIFNAGVACFKNNEVGLACLKDWREKCLESCENNPESGRYGDQQYLDEWPKRFSGVCVFDGKGANLGPWNIVQYKISKAGRSYNIDEDPLIFYHFSSLRIYSPRDFLLFDYSYKSYISKTAKEAIYRPYLKELGEIITKIKSVEPGLALNFDIKPPFWENTRSHIKYDLVKIHIRLKRKIPLYSSIFYRFFKRKKVGHKSI